MDANAELLATAVGAVATPLLGAIGVLWSKLASMYKLVKDERDATVRRLDEQQQKYENRIEALQQRHQTDLAEALMAEREARVADLREVFEERNWRRNMAEAVARLAEAQERARRGRG